jgi:ABC-2 type transport system permease protein
MLLQYRAAAVAGLGCQFFWGLILMMILEAFYRGSSETHPMSLPEAVAYIWLGQAFFAMLPFRAEGDLDHLIRTGNVAYEWLRPVDVYRLWFSRTLATRIAPTAIRAVPMLTVVLIVGWVPLPEPANLLAFSAALLGAAMLTTAIAMVMNVSIFWTLSGRGVNILVSTLIFLLGGMIVPLPLFPEPLQPILKLLPFRGVIDTPGRLYLGHIPLSEFPAAAAHQAIWIAVIIGFGHWLMKRASSRLVIQGG